ncbi:hypothetical protein ACTMU2_14335 [Cupriavidus basilensis]
MATKKLTLDDLLSGDDGSGLLDVKPRSSTASTEASRARAQFEEINAFIDKMGFLPGKGKAGRRITVSERALQTRLRAYLDNAALHVTVEGLDRHGLLAAAKAEPKTIDEILDGADELLDDPNAGIFEMRHVRTALGEAGDGVRACQV